MHEIELEYIDHKLNKREEVRYHRRRSAWFLAAKLGDVTSDSYEKAYSLLDRCKNVALGFYNLDQTETERNCNSPARAAKRDRLISRMEKLNSELEPYGCKIVRAWCIEDVYDFDFEHNVPLNDYGYLHFFD